MPEQLIPLESVGYIDPPTRKFIVPFNLRINPVESSMIARTLLDSIPSLLESGVTKLVVYLNHSPGPRTRIFRPETFSPSFEPYVIVHASFISEASPQT